jgi:hypothetical protein
MTDCLPVITRTFEELYPDFTIAFQGAKELYRNPKKYLNASIEITGDRKYLMGFLQEKPYSYRKGIYNETRKEWKN